jgi:adenine/guanine phosphoribosyltransferase-like PRPP-binding protein
MGYDRNREMHIHTGAIAQGSRVLVVDDVLAVGGTILAAVDLVEQAAGKVIGVSVAFENWSGSKPETGLSNAASPSMLPFDSRLPLQGGLYAR